MKHLTKISLILILMLTMIAFAEDDNLFEHKRVGFGYSSDGGGVHNLSADATLPLDFIHGGIQANLLRTISNEEAIADEADVTVEGGYETNLYQVKAFAGVARSLQRKTDFEKKFGGYIGTGAIKIGSIAQVEIGAGSLIESIEIQEALGLEDENVGRLLTFAKIGFWRISSIIEFTPQFNLSDTQIDAQSDVVLSDQGNFQLLFSNRLQYDSDPYGEGQSFINQWSLRANYNFN